jgi:hypothetical protein
LLICLLSVYYGPDSLYSSFEADSCAIQLGLPTCALWQPDPLAFVKLVTHEVPDIVGGWGLLGIVLASMSTADGAVLAIGTVMSHNVIRQFAFWRPAFAFDCNVLLMARFMTLPFTIIAAMVAVQSGDKTGYLLTVAFDIMLATVVVPLVGCFYTVNPSPRAALVAIMAGASTRIILEFLLPKDGSLIFPFPGDYFLNMGPAASVLYPSFIDVNASEHWNPSEQACEQRRFDDFTGVDSLVAPFVALVLFCIIQTWENVIMKRALFSFPGDCGYEKVFTTDVMTRNCRRRVPSINVASNLTNDIPDMVNNNTNNGNTTRASSCFLDNEGTKKGRRSSSRVLVPSEFDKSKIINMENNMIDFGDMDTNNSFLDLALQELKAIHTRLFSSKSTLPSHSIRLDINIISEEVTNNDTSNNPMDVASQELNEIQKRLFSSKHFIPTTHTDSGR